MNFVRNSKVVMNAAKFYLAWFYFRYDSLILDILDWENLNTTSSVVMPAQTHPYSCHLELKIRNVQANKGNPKIHTHLCQIHPVCAIIISKMPDRSVFCTTLGPIQRQQTVSFALLKDQKIKIQLVSWMS